MIKNNKQLIVAEENVYILANKCEIYRPITREVVPILFPAGVYLRMHDRANWYIEVNDNHFNKIKLIDFCGSVK